MQDSKMPKRENSGKDSCRERSIENPGKSTQLVVGYVILDNDSLVLHLVSINEGENRGDLRSYTTHNLSIQA